MLHMLHNAVQGSTHTALHTFISSSDELAIKALDQRVLVIYPYLVTRGLMPSALI